MAGRALGDDRAAPKRSTVRAHECGFHAGHAGERIRPHGLARPVEERVELVRTGKPSWKTNLNTRPEQKPRGEQQQWKKWENGRPTGKNLRFGHWFVCFVWLLIITGECEILATVS